MNWTIDQLEAFITAAHCGSFSSAARKLGKAQSRISTSIANLEVDLNLTLFDRSKRLPVLTQAGQQLLDEAQMVMNQCQRLQARASTAANEEEIELVIAADEAVLVGTLQAVFKKISTKFPLLKLTLMSGSRNDISALVESGKADIGLLFHVGELSKNLDFLAIGSFNNVLIVSHHHVLANIEAPTLAQLQEHRQLLICNHQGQSREQPITANHWNINSYYGITEMVIEGLGWALVPENIALSEWYKNDIKQLSSKHILSNIRVEIGLTKRKDRGQGIVLAWLINELESTIESKR
ncbi:LysR family transcriptional regulator [Psychromonas hadalis]|uniref:LysR family transcriptional regulator n=1 Tax=Psychromonas hadalis TaxID=211669 RepID=UPI0003B433A1|nr:LysR family transcriptional regulator [Psychromonas hadalis]